ncbi:MAG TPA: M48 family metallopeptidase [Myxococcota bacterium]|nr:M48 family metallopeptidase [Myxococcota bacterium]HNH47523.1 M48 family metallopeptidase [Myxococcota bacterium]
MQRDPTLRVPVDFNVWMVQREARQHRHLIAGIPDYAFYLDLKIRRQLEAMGPLRAVAQALNAGTVPIQRALHEVQGVAVSPRQLPQVHAMGVACAERLGIGVPQIFIVQNPMMNAFTFATSEVDQLVVLTSGLVQALDPAELQFVIGHECGHIHNRHVVYNTLWELLTNRVARELFRGAISLLGPAAWVGQLLALAFTAATLYTFGRWHRCAEITCDRAGLICSGDTEAAQRVNGKLHMGGLGNLDGFSAEEYRTQTRTYSKSWLRIMELIQTHPPGPKRAQAMASFLRTDIFAEWRPELRRDGPTVPLAEVDAELEKLIL